VNPALTQAEEEFVATLLAGLDAYPAYYAHMAPANAAGPAAVDLSPPRPADRSSCAGGSTPASGWTCVPAPRSPGTPGTPTRAARQLRHLPGWLIPWGAPVTLLGETAADAAAAGA
jgi:hypothetical protein